MQKIKIISTYISVSEEFICSDVLSVLHFSKNKSHCSKIYQILMIYDNDHTLKDLS